MSWEDEKNMKTKDVRGITIISLVVTIVVLLILAGVSISTLVGENGVVDNAKKHRIIHIIKLQGTK